MLIAYWASLATSLLSSLELLRHLELFSSSTSTASKMVSALALPGLGCPMTPIGNKLHAGTYRLQNSKPPKKAAYQWHVCISIQS